MPFVGIGNILGGGSAKISYAKKLAKAYEARVIADGGVVESLGCFTAFATSLGAYQPPIALAATGIGEISFTANWKSFKGAKYYLLDVSTSPTFATFVYENQKVNAPATSYVVIGLNSNTTYYYRVRASTFEVEYGDVLNYAMSQGYTLPSAGQQVLQNQLVVDLKAGGIWSKLDTFAVFATDGDSDFALIDWKRLTDYTAVNSPTFTTNQGFQGNNTSSYIDLNVSPLTAANFKIINSSMGVYYANVLTRTNTKVGFGVRADNNDRSTGISPYNTLTAISGISNDQGFQVPTYSRGNGYFHLNRNNEFNYDFYLNGVLVTNVTGKADVVNSKTGQNFYALALNSNGVAVAFSDDIISALHVGASFNLTETQNLNTYIDNYINSL